MELEKQEMNENRSAGTEKKEKRPAELSCRDLTLGYDGKELVSHLSCTVRKGDYLCIIGENGAGKSTLMRTILGLQKPMSGRVIYENGLTSQLIGYLPQQTEVQRDFPASVREIVLSGFQAQLKKSFFYSREMKAAAEENMRIMGIEHLARESFSTLSGGQKQRVLLARAISASRRMLLLDEPVAGLDPAATADLYSLIERLNREGTTIVMISHDLAAAVEYASHILYVGKELFFGTAEESHRNWLGRRHNPGDEKTRPYVRRPHPM